MQQKRLTRINEALDMIVIGIQAVIRRIEKNNGTIIILQCLICNKFNYNPQTLIHVANIFNINCKTAYDKAVVCNNDLKAYFYAHFQLN